LTRPLGRGRAENASGTSRLPPHKVPPNRAWTTRKIWTQGYLKKLRKPCQECRPTEYVAYRGEGGGEIKEGPRPTSRMRRANRPTSGYQPARTTGRTTRNRLDPVGPDNQNRGRGPGQPGAGQGAARPATRRAVWQWADGSTFRRSNTERRTDSKSLATARA